MRIIFACIILLLMVGNTYSQQTQIEFIPGSGDLYPYINSYSSSEGLKQYYFENSTWVRNQAIPDFMDKNNFKDLALQYIVGNTINSPQLFAYSKATGDFSFYFLTSDGWALNDYMPSGKIGINSDNITSTYTPSEIGKSSFIFSHSSDGSTIEFLELTSGSWNKIKSIPQEIPNN